MPGASGRVPRPMSKVVRSNWYHATVGQGRVQADRGCWCTKSGFEQVEISVLGVVNLPEQAVGEPVQGLVGDQAVGDRVSQPGLTGGLPGKCSR